MPAMNRTLALFLLLSLGVAIAAGAIVAGRPGHVPGSAVHSGPDAGSEAAFERIAQLEQALADEIAEREALAARLALLEPGAATSRVERADDAGEPSREAERAAVREQGRSRDLADFARNMAERRVDMLVEHGFGEDEARRLLKLEAEAQFAALRAEWEMQFGEGSDPAPGLPTAEAMLRAQLGDEAYARYLEAQGMPTDVQVLQVHEGSPAGSAGLQAGDRVVGYNGERVFNILDLRRLTMETRPGRSVIVEIDRDGTRMQVTMPSGPIGITGTGVPYPGRSRVPGG